MAYKYQINKDFQNLNAAVVNIKELFSSSYNTIHKARNELKTVTINSHQFIIKAFKVPNIINQIAYSFFRNSKAKKAYEYALKIAKFTPAPVAYVEFYTYGLLKESYFISEKFEYDFTIREPLLDKNFPQRDVIFKAFAEFTLELHNNNIFHNDYSPGNILIKKEKKKFIFKIVDINRMKFLPLNEEQRAKNFSKLWADKNTLDIIATQYLKSFKASNTFKEKVFYYSQKNKNIKNFKKRLKGKPVTD